jgi:hypothetical protein
VASNANRPGSDPVRRGGQRHDAEPVDGGPVGSSAAGTGSRNLVVMDADAGPGARVLGGGRRFGAGCGELAGGG